jgi:hypothetical protein
LAFEVAFELAAASAHNLLMIGPIFDRNDANGRTDLAFPAEKRSMDEAFLQIYGFYCDLGLYIENQVSSLRKTRYRDYCRLTE